MRWMPWLVAAGMLATGSGCIPGRAALPAPTDTTVTLVVRNDRGTPITIEALFSGSVRRLGVVDPGATGRFVLAPEVYRTGRVAFRASGFPGGVIQSEWVNISRGQGVEFLVSTSLGSSILVRP